LRQRKAREAGGRPCKAGCNDAMINGALILAAAVGV
jgi:hypothetical protein